MANNTFATLGIFVVLLLSLGLTSALTSNGVTLTLNDTALTNVSAGETYAFLATVQNLNGTDFYMDFETTGWSWNTSGENITNGTTKTFQGILTVPSSGNQNAILNLYNTSNQSQEFFDIDQLISLSYYSAPVVTYETYCEEEGYSETGDLEIKDFNVNNKGEGKDDEWQYLDDIEITVEVENTNNDDNVDDVEVRMLILDDKIENGGNDVTNDFDLDDEVQDNIGRLKDGDKEEVIFSINELPTDVEDGTYYMYIMTYERGSEEDQCTSDIDGDDYFQFSVESVDYDKSIIAKGAELETQINTYCGQEDLEISIPVYNLGDDSEERVLVNLYNSELGVDEYAVINNLNDGDKEVVRFFINLPLTLSRDRYDLNAIISFDWDDNERDDDASSYDEENSDTSIRLNVLGCKAISPSVTANLISTAEVGQDLVIKAVVKNNDKVNDFTITPVGFESWADLVSVTPQTVSIASEGSQEILITLSPKQFGAQTFTINTVIDGNSYPQQVSVNIAKQSGIFSSLDLSGTSLYLAIGIASLLLLIFLVLIVKIARKPAKAAF